MMRRFPLSFFVLPLLTGCMATPMPRVSAIAAGQAVASAAAQVKRCYRDPPAPSAARRIITRLRVHYGPDGTLVGFPEIVSQEGITASNRAYAERMAQAASLAVIRCSPLHLPAEAHRGGWDEFDLIFGHAMLA